jgi:rare lipoprotein A
MKALPGCLIPAIAVLAITCAPAPAAAAKKTAETRTYGRFLATAYCRKGITKSGRRTRRGIVAADPRVLPLGSLIRVYNAAGYSGEYEVLDTGAKVKGRHIDIYMSRRREALEFGRHRVIVEVLRYGVDFESAGGRGTRAISG